jgi:uncharacterized protein DUF3565
MKRESPKLVLRKITGFQKDEKGDWVAELACGHKQHVRHRPPWELRPWVTTVEGRAGHLGRKLECVACQLPKVGQASVS